MTSLFILDNDNTKFAFGFAYCRRSDSLTRPQFVEFCKLFRVKKQKRIPRHGGYDDDDDDDDELPRGLVRPSAVYITHDWFACRSLPRVKTRCPALNTPT